MTNLEIFVVVAFFDFPYIDMDTFTGWTFIPETVDNSILVEFDLTENDDKDAKD